MAKAFRELIGVGPSTASTKDSVLIIIDAQNEYAKGHLKTENVASTRKAISTLLEKYRAASAPLVHTIHQTPPRAPVFTPDTDLAKKFSDSFTSTDLEEFLKSTGKNKLVLTDDMAHVCVSTMARQAAEKGYDVLIAEDPVGDRNIPDVDGEQLVRMALVELTEAFGTVKKSSCINLVARVSF
ncbi:unnamed protein product [Diplocarpon coronariae]